MINKSWGWDGMDEAIDGKEVRNVSPTRHAVRPSREGGKVHLQAAYTVLVSIHSIQWTSAHFRLVAPTT